MLAASVAALSGDGAPATIAHGCGSSKITPVPTWFAPDQPLTINVRAEAGQVLLMTDANGRALESKAPTDVSGEKTVNLNDLYVQTTIPGTYVLYLTKKDGAAADFTGTPLVVSIREDRRRGAPTGPMVIRVEPLREPERGEDLGIDEVVQAGDPPA